MVDRLVILRDDIPVLRILILEIIILIIREIIIVEYGIKTLILRNLMVPIRFGGISFLGAGRYTGYGSRTSFSPFGLNTRLLMRPYRL